MVNILLGEDHHGVLHLSHGVLPMVAGHHGHCVLVVVDHHSHGAPLRACTYLKQQQVSDSITVHKTRQVNYSHNMPIYKSSFIV